MSLLITYLLSLPTLQVEALERSIRLGHLDGLYTYSMDISRKNIQTSNPSG